MKRSTIIVVGLLVLGLVGVVAYSVAQDADVPNTLQPNDKSLINDLPQAEPSQLPSALPLALESRERFRMKIGSSAIYVLDTTTGQVWWNSTLGSSSDGWKSFPPLPTIPSTTDK